MKKVTTLLSLLVFSGISAFAQLGINADNSQPDASAMLDVKSASKGLLPPRVALTAINSTLPVTTPAVGLLVYNTAVAGAAPNNVTPGYYNWNGTKWAPVTPPQGTNVGDMLYWNGTQWVGVPAGSDGQVLTFMNGVPIWGGKAVLCSTLFTVKHVIGDVAPVSKTVSYGTLTNIPGEPAKCWITSNLGADHQATAVNDATEASAGWYWQFNRKQGYKHDGTTRTPNTAWIISIIENSDWVAANDPCKIELGPGWRIPTSTEWTNVDATGNWTDWNGPWNSGLKIHAAGGLSNIDGSLVSRGPDGRYWSNGQASGTNGSDLAISSTQCGPNDGMKAYGFSIRCIRDF